jgi:hypothetical protein
MKYIAAAVAAMGSTTASAATLAELASKVEANGWLSGSYIYTFNQAEPGENGAGVLHANDLKSDSFIFNQAAINLTSAPEEGFGGAVSLLAGEDAATVVNPSYGENDGDKFAVQQAYLTYATGALTITAGRYNSLAGYEVVADPLNATVSRSLLFPNAEPYFHTGVRAAYAASDAATLYLGVNNSAALGAANDDNQQKTVEVGGFFTLSESFTLGIYDYYGKEGYWGDVKTNYLDFVASFTATDTLSFALTGDYVTVEDTIDILGFAGYATLAFTDTLSATLRLETLSFEPDEGEKLTVNEATLAFKYTPASDFIFLAEARVDDADEDIYVDGDEITGTAPQLGVKAIYTFGL